MKIKNMVEDERPIEKSMKKGMARLSNAELVAVLIGSGTKEKSAVSLAEEIISKEKSGLRYLAESSVEELIEFSGVGPTKAAKILAAVELGKRISTSPTNEKVIISSSESIAHLFMEDLRYEKKEYFKEILLNSKLEIIAIETVSIGALSSTVVHPREVFKPAIKRSASAIIFIHNHPTGDPKPSKEDINTTEKLKQAGELLGIPVLDHVIIGDGKYQSMREMKLI